MRISKPNLPSRIVTADPETSSTGTITPAGRNPVRIVAPAGTASKNDSAHHLRVSVMDRCLFARQLAMLLRAGLPLVPALGALAEQLEGEPLSQIIGDVREQVQAGTSLAQALAQYPEIFSPLFVNITAAGEVGGNLEQVLFRLADTLQKKVELTNKVCSAIAYPLMMTVVAAAVVVFLLSYVVPSITQILLETGQTLPWPTKLLIALGTFTKKYFVIFALVLFVALIAVRAWVRTEQGRLIWDRCKLRLPLFGKLIIKLEIARIARTLGALLDSGIGLLNALEVTKSVSQNAHLAHALASVKDRVVRGDSLATAIRNSRLFPPIVFHIAASGQLSGNIEFALTSIADLYDGEVENTTKRLLTLLEPAILLVMGFVVGFIVLAILLPIFEINQMF